MYLRVVCVVQYIICDCSTVLLTLTMTVSDCVQNKQNRKHFKFSVFFILQFSEEQAFMNTDVHEYVSKSKRSCAVYLY